ncbi:MAG: DNA polymerase IV [Sphaerochaetaceae bacterium]|nr:DNA polymerase IV [Sphaerochaetaceae bacterium]MDD3163567.1 DNA polymerase IV [Sphaerochaetaceae bacterium]MDD4006604.1 DNA polymerase IV [Sphaerochaetaceae bacterium]MDD4396659.1 DNA polymerase IV [Sphaerochaetaceae bacterium]
MGSVFFHVDLDAFFASVEQRNHPEYRGKPLIIGMPERRSVVSTCSYEARKFGVHSAMPSLQAQRLCPDGIFIPGNYKEYQKVSRQVMDILRRFSPSVQQVSIDEAFLDMTGTDLLFGPPRQACVTLKKAVFDETGLTVSVGVAHNRFVAKLASDFHKPDGICAVSPSKEEIFIDKVGLAKLWGIGKSTLSTIQSKGIRTTQEVRSLSLRQLEGLFGDNLASYLFKAVRGIDPGICEQETKSHSISSEQTFIDDVYSEETLSAVLLQMSTEVMLRAIDENVMPRTIGVKIRYGSFETTTVQATPDDAVLNTNQVFEQARSLFLSKWKRSEGIRLLGLGLYQVYTGDAPMQGELFNQTDQKRRALDKTILTLSKKGHSMKKASTLSKPDET